MTAEVWRDPAVPAEERVGDLMSRMTVREKVAQLYGVWVGIDTTGGDVAPHQHELASPPDDWEALISDGIGQLTRPFGTRPVEPTAGVRVLARTQRQIMAAGRFGIPALVHEEILTGLAAWQATIFPSPLCWGASFDPALVERMGAQIGRTMRRLGVHQGLAPVLDVVRDLRWGRVEETIGEDPYLVGSIGSAYVRGVESAGVVATLKHFAGYSASRGGRNLAPVSIGQRELADVLLPPFEMALRAGARSVMNAYVDLDGVPAAIDPALFTERLRGEYGFTGTVVADYFAITFLHTLHNVAGTDAEAAGLALNAGIDVELPTVRCFGPPLLDAIEAGHVDVATIDRALKRVLIQKCELGLLDADWSPEPVALVDEDANLDEPQSRELARELAQRSIVLLRNENATLPLAPGKRIALIGPRAHEASAMMGCYSFPLHVGVHHPDVPIGIDVPTLLEVLSDAPSSGSGSSSDANATATADSAIGATSTIGTTSAIGATSTTGTAPEADTDTDTNPTRTDATSTTGTDADANANANATSTTGADADPNRRYGYQVTYAQGVPVLGGDDAGIEEAVRVARDAEVCVVVLGDKAGLFGLGTSGEGCDASDLRLPGRQEELLEAVLATGTPVVLVLLVGRPYELSRQVDRLAAVVCGFFPGEEGARAMADVLSGRVNPSGRLPVGFPAAGSTQPSTYLNPPLGHASGVTTVDPTPLFPFGHGLSYAPATWGEITLASPTQSHSAHSASVQSAQWPTDGTCTLTVTLRNDSTLPTAEVVQVYLHDPVAEVARPIQKLIAAPRVDLAPGEARTVTVELHADLTSYTGRAGRRQVDTGEVELQVGASSADIRAKLRLTMTGQRREVGFDRVMEPTVTMSDAGSAATASVSATSSSAPSSSVTSHSVASDGVASASTVPGSTLPENTTPENTAPDGTASESAPSESAASANAVPAPPQVLPTN